MSLDVKVSPFMVKRYDREVGKRLASLGLVSGFGYIEACRDAAVDVALTMPGGHSIARFTDFVGSLALQQLDARVLELPLKGDV